MELKKERPILTNMAQHGHHGHVLIKFVYKFDKKEFVLKYEKGNWSPCEVNGQWGKDFVFVLENRTDI